MTLREQLTALIGDVTYVDAKGSRYGMRLIDVPPDYKDSVKYEMSPKGARLVVFLCNNAEAIRDALP